MLPSDRVARSRKNDRLIPPFVGPMRRKEQVCSVSVVSKMRYRLGARETIRIAAHDDAQRAAGMGDDGTNDQLVSEVIRAGRDAGVVRRWTPRRHSVRRTLTTQPRMISPTSGDHSRIDYGKARYQAGCCADVRPELTRCPAMRHQRRPAGSASPAAGHRRPAEIDARFGDYGASAIKVLTWRFTPGRGLFHIHGDGWVLGGCTGAVGPCRPAVDAVP